jgi:FMN-dependent NADH-azoreductase
MSTVLYVTANPKTVEESFSLSVGEAFLETYKIAHPEDQISILDLYKTDIPTIDADVFTGWGKLAQGTAFDQLTPDEQNKVGQMDQFCNQFVEADKYIFVTPLWNLSIPPKMKAYLDTICIAGKTFKYTASGPVGLLKDKKALHIQARGGTYSSGPAQDIEFGDRYIRALLNFLGVTAVQSLIAEGMAQNPEKAEEIKKHAIEKAMQLAQDF